MELRNLLFKDSRSYTALAVFPVVEYVLVLLQHFNDFYILMAGRLLGGVATSILYSAFESWVIFEHNKVCGNCPYIVYFCHERVLTILERRRYL